MTGLAVVDAPGGTSTVIVSDTTFTATTDLSGVETSVIQFGDGATDLVVGNGVTLGIREAHLADIVGDGVGSTITDAGADVGNLEIFGFTGSVDIAEIDVAGSVTGFVSGAQSLVGEDTNFEELTALVLTSGSSLDLSATQADRFALSLTKQDGAGNVTVTAGGNLSSLNLSAVDVLTLNAATTLPDSTADLPSAIDADGEAITVGNTIDLSGVTISNYDDLTVDTNQLTLSVDQLDGFDDAGTVLKTNGGLIYATTGTADISSLTLETASSIVVNVADADVIMTLTQHQLLSSTSGLGGDNTITLTQNGTATGKTGVEKYVLADGANNFSLADGGQWVESGNGNDLINGGTGNDVIDGGAGVDNLNGDLGADIFVFNSGDTGQTSLTADMILDFTTGADSIRLGEAIDGFTSVNGVEMTQSTFLTNATGSFNGGLDVYVAYDVAGSGDTWVAIDHSKDGNFGTGDTFIVLDNLNSAGDILNSDFVV